MRTLTTELPDELTPQQEHDLKMHVAGKLYSKGLLSGGEAAKVVGIGRGDFFWQIGQYGYSIITNYAGQDLGQDLIVLHGFFRKNDNGKHDYLTTDLLTRFQNWYKINCNGD